MTHRITRLEFWDRPGVLTIRAMGVTGRGTKFHIRSVTVPTDGLSNEAKKTARQAAIQKILVDPTVVGL